MITHRIWIVYMTLILLELELLSRFTVSKFFDTGFIVIR